MRQLFQSLANGDFYISSIPSPKLKKGHLLIQSRLSLISVGTEKMLASFGKSNYIDKAKQQPDKVKDVINKVKTDGLIATYDAVKSKLNDPIPLGYSNVGTVIGIGEGVKNFQLGDRVISNGPHAEIVSVPVNLCCKVPEGVEDEEAIFTVLASIGLQSIRLAKPAFGETFLVSGLGLVGILTAQLLKAQGCIVLGCDYDSNKCEVARQLGIDVIDLNHCSEPVSIYMSKTSNRGIDGAIVTASTRSTEPIHTAAKACRQRGRIILVGVTGMELSRDMFYKKELSFQVSCSYGPGRYDKNYEEIGIDYPYGLVRWTEQRNFEAVLNSLSTGILKTKSLISRYFEFDDIQKAYDLIVGSGSVLGVIIKYSSPTKNLARIIDLGNEVSKKNITSSCCVSVLGCGNHSKRFLIPAFASSDVLFETICATTGKSPYFTGKKFSFKNASTDSDSIFNDNTSNTIVIATHHDSHAEFVMKAIESGKNVYVEKPLCLSLIELNKIKELYYASIKKYCRDIKLMVGFNRRFSPMVTKIKELLRSSTSPKSFIYTVNAGFLPEDHWINNENVGGGRLISEACHFVDLICHVSGSRIKKIDLSSLDNNNIRPETFSLQMTLEDGSIGTVHYFSNGSKSFSKERFEVFDDGNIIQLDNFRRLKYWGSGTIKTQSSLFQDKGHKICVKEFIKSIKEDTQTPIRFEEIYDLHKLLIPLT